MSQAKRIGDLELNEDMSFQRHEWTVQRIAWIVMVLLILAAVAGLLGSGPISETTAGQEQSSLWVEHQRFGRLESPEELHIHIGPGAAGGGTAKIWISRAYLEAMKIEQITPEPQSTEARPDRLVFTFETPDAAKATAVVFHLQPQHPGSRRGQVGLVGGPTLDISQFIYP